MYEMPSDEVMNRLAAITANNPLYKKARAKRLADEARINKLWDSQWPRQHPFECDPKKPGLHP